MQGWIKLHRKILGWEWYQDANTMRVFLHLTLKANHKKSRWQGIEIEIGSHITSRKVLAFELNLTDQQIRTSLKKLESTGEITIKSTNRFTVVSICHYKDYQENEGGHQPTDNQQITNKQPTDNQQITTNKNDKKEYNDKNDKKNTPLTPRGEALNIPEGINHEIWKAFKEMRQKSKSTLTDHAQKLIISKLKAINKETGQDPNDILNQSILNGWKGVFPINQKTINKGNYHGKPNTSQIIRDQFESFTNSLVGDTEKKFIC